MVALDFPAAPSNGQVYDGWTYDGTKWNLTGGGVGGGSGYTFTQSSTPTGTVTGQTWYNTTTGLSYVWHSSAWVQTTNGAQGAWTSWTPAVTQSNSVASTNTRSRYAKHGRTVIAYCNVAITGTGTPDNAILVTLPVAAADINCLRHVGVGVWFDNSPFSSAKGTVTGATTTTVGFEVMINGNNVFRLGESISGYGTAITTNDGISFTAIYEAAS